jgi:MerR family transcriptional regulator, light-induced transcriptional regulator
VSEGRADEVAEPPTDAPTLTVAAVARRLGVAPATLRTWARRYGLGPTEHIAGSHRRYGPDDLGRLLVMRRLTHEGVSPAQAAGMALADDALVPDGPVSLALGGPRTREAHPGPPVRGRGFAAGAPGRAGGGRVVPMPAASPAVRGLARASMALDAHGVSEVLRRSVRVDGVIKTWETLAVPVLIGLGERYAATGEGIEVEHLFSECLMGVLRSAADHLTQSRNTVPVLLACIGDEQHSLPLHAILAALAERGVAARQLGMRVPAEAMASAVRRSGAGVVLLFAALPVESLDVLTLLARVRPAPRVLLGGPGWPAALPSAGASHVVSLGDAVEQVIAAVL